MTDLYIIAFIFTHRARIYFENIQVRLDSLHSFNSILFFVLKYINAMKIHAEFVWITNKRLLYLQ